MCVCMGSFNARTRGSVSRGQNEADPRVGRWLSLLHYFILLFFFYLFTNCTATSVSFSYVFFFIIIFVSCYVCSITAGICRSAWPYACVAACTYYPVTYTACGFKVWLPVCVCVCVCTLVCVYMFICVSVSVSVETSLSACMFIRVCKRVSCVYTCVYIYVIRSSYEFRRCVSIRKNGRVRMA